MAYQVGIYRDSGRAADNLWGLYAFLLDRFSNWHIHILMNVTCFVKTNLRNWYQMDHIQYRWPVVSRLLSYGKPVLVPEDALKVPHLYWVIETNFSIN